MKPRYLLVPIGCLALTVLVAIQLRAPRLTRLKWYTATYDRIPVVGGLITWMANELSAHDYAYLQRQSPKLNAALRQHPTFKNVRTVVDTSMGEGVFLAGDREFSDAEKVELEQIFRRYYPGRKLSIAIQRDFFPVP